MIYKITNNLNGKIYIGGTVKKNLKERFNEHFAHAKKYNSQTEKMKDMRNIPKINWSIEKIEDCDDIKIKERENYWIKKYKEEFKENLYNENLNSGMSVKFYSYDLITKEIKEYNSLKETNCNFSKVSSILNNINENGYCRFSHKNKLWSYINTLKNWNYLLEKNKNKKKQKRKILCVEKGIIYNSITEANIDFGVNKKHNSIINCLQYNLKNKDKKKRKAFGYNWEYVND